MLHHLIQLLHQGNCSCVIAQKGDIRVFTQRGVNDLYDLLEQEPHFLQGAIMADKVVGKAAAALMIKGGVTQLYTDVISELALKLLDKTHIEVSYATKVPTIMRRDGQGVCPLEMATQQTDDPERIYQIISQH